MNDDTAKALRAPFPEDQIGKLPKVNCTDCSSKDKTCAKHQKRVCKVCKAYVSTQHIHVDYVGHAHVTERLLLVDPQWSWEPFSLNGMGLPALDETGGLWIRLTIGGKTMIGYGDAPGKRAAVKELIGDAIRNAAMRFGVALDLWKKEPAAPVEQEPARPQPKPQTPEKRAGELRGQIAAIGFQDDKSVEDIASEFYEWSGKKAEINSASVVLLAEYLSHIGGTP